MHKFVREVNAKKPRSDGLGGLVITWSKIVRLKEWNGCNSIYCMCGRWVRERFLEREPLAYEACHLSQERVIPDKVRPVSASLRS